MYAQDMAKAKEYLAKCKYKTPDERKIDITWVTEVPAEEKIALLMKSGFDPLGFETSIKGTPWTLYTQQVTKPEIHAGDLGSSISTRRRPIPNSILYNMYYSKVPPTWESASHLNDAEVDKLLDTGRSETDIAKRKDDLQNLEARLDEVAPAIFAERGGRRVRRPQHFPVAALRGRRQAVLGRGIRAAIPHGRNGQVEARPSMERRPAGSDGLRVAPSPPPAGR